MLVEITAKDGNENELQDEFRNGRCGPGTDPRDHIKKLQDPQEKLEQRHEILKTDDDIIHQVLEVVGSKHRHAGESLKHDMVVNENVTLEKASKRLGARHNEIKRRKKSRKKHRKRRDDSDSESESNESSEETAEDKGLAGRVIEELRRETNPEMRRQLVPSWRERDRSHGDEEKGHAARDGQQNGMGSG